MSENKIHIDSIPLDELYLHAMKLLQIVATNNGVIIELDETLYLEDLPNCFVLCPHLKVDYFMARMPDEEVFPFDVFPEQWLKGNTELEARAKALLVHHLGFEFDEDWFESFDSNIEEELDDA